jgi:hypothetical protein
MARHFVIELGEYKLEHNEITERTRFYALSFALLFLLDKGVNRPRLPRDVVDALSRSRQVGDFVKVVWVFSMPDDRLDAVAPKGERRSRGMGVGSTLFLAVLCFPLFDFEDEVGNRRTIGVENDDIGPLRTVPAECNRIFDRKAAQGITILPRQAHNPKVAGRPPPVWRQCLSCGWEPEKGFLALFNEKGLKCLQFNAT